MDFLNGALPDATKPLTGDDFFVDDLLDFSKIDTEEDESDRKDNNFSFFSVSQKTEHAGFSVPDTELFLPADDVEDLEWLSQFVDDTISGCSLSLPDGKSSKNQSKPEPVFPVLEKSSSFRKSVQTKARSKRAKTGGRVWSFKLPTELVTVTSSPSQQPRRCSHCLVQKTPQWRTGPLGAKTLCNACGVRFKSGRLLPEYRPACSPTFSSEVHSNNHRKVLEMRRKKEGDSEPDSDSVQPFHRF